MKKEIKYSFILFFLLIFFFSINTNLPNRQNWGFFSDESSYFSITQSLAFDFDIQYTKEQDLLRIKKYFHTLPVGIHLKQVPDGRLFYAKSFAYPMVAAPFFRIFGVRGFLLLNGLMLFFSLLMGYYLLKQYHSETHSILFACVFIFASITPIYIWWITADLFNFFVLFSGLFFFFYRFKKPWPFYLSALFFSFSVFSKPWNPVAIGIIYLILLYRRQWKRFIILSLISLLIFSALVLFLFLQTGELHYSLFQGGKRRQFTSSIPFATPDSTFEQGDNVSFDGFWDKLYTSPHIVALNLFYYFFGRHTGMFIYFASAFFVLLLFIFQRKIPEDWFVLSAITMAILVFTTLAPDNYFGGSGSLGNRYFFNIFPLFFFLGYRQRTFKFLFIPVVISLVFLSGTYTDSHYRSTSPRHTGISYPARLFPPEKTQYLSLPTNENPRAFGKLIRDGNNRYQIYFLNDNFHEVENNSFFWTKGSKNTELFLSSPHPVKEFQVALNSKMDGNKIVFKIEDQKKQMIINTQKSYFISIKHARGLKIKSKYLYFITVKSKKSYNGILLDERDTRNLGVKVQIGLVF